MRLLTIDHVYLLSGRLYHYLRRQRLLQTWASEAQILLHLFLGRLKLVVPWILSALNLFIRVLCIATHYLIVSVVIGSFWREIEDFDANRFAPLKANLTKGWFVGEYTPAFIWPHLIPLFASLIAPKVPFVSSRSLKYDATKNGSAGQYNTPGNFSEQEIHWCHAFLYLCNVRTP